MAGGGWRVAGHRLFLDPRVKPEDDGWGKHGIPDLPLMLRCLADRPSLEASCATGRRANRTPSPFGGRNVPTPAVILGLDPRIHDQAHNPDGTEPPAGSAAVGWRIRPRTPTKNGDAESRLRRQINASPELSSPPPRAKPTMPPFRHRMHRVMRTRRGGAGAGSGSDRRLFISGARSGPPSLKKRRASAAPKRATTPSRKGGGPCREGEFQGRKTPNGAPQGAIYFLTYEAACSAPSEPLRAQGRRENERDQATGRNRRREGEAVCDHGVTGQGRG